MADATDCLFGGKRNIIITYILENLRDDRSTVGMGSNDIASNKYFQIREGYFFNFNCTPKDGLHL